MRPIGTLPVFLLETYFFTVGTSYLSSLSESLPDSVETILRFYTRQTSLREIFPLGGNHYVHSELRFEGKLVVRVETLTFISRQTLPCGNNTSLGNKAFFRVTKPFPRVTEPSLGLENPCLGLETLILGLRVGNRIISSITLPCQWT